MLLIPINGVEETQVDGPKKRILIVRKVHGIVLIVPVGITLTAVIDEKRNLMTKEERPKMNVNAEMDTGTANMIIGMMGTGIANMITGMSIENAETVLIDIVGTNMIVNDKKNLQNPHHLLKRIEMQQIIVVATDPNPDQYQKNILPTIKQLYQYIQ